MKAPMSTQDWEALVESTKRWAYDACRSDVDTDHPQGVWVLDKPFNELCAHVSTGDSMDKWLQAYEGAVIEAKAVIAELEEGVKIWKQNTMNASRRIGELEARVEQLEHLRQMAINIEACLGAGVWPMQFIRETFQDAISRTAPSELKKEQEGDAL